MKVYSQFLSIFQCIGDARAIVTTSKPLPPKLASGFITATQKQTRSLTLYLDHDASLNISFFFCNESNNSIERCQLSLRYGY